MSIATVVSSRLVSDFDLLAQATPNGIPGWVWLVAIVLALVILAEFIYALIFGRRTPREEESAHAPGGDVQHRAAVSAAEPTTPAPIEPFAAAVTAVRPDIVATDRVETDVVAARIVEPEAAHAATVSVFARPEDSHSGEVFVVETETPGQAPEHVNLPEVGPTSADDLKIIEGIGPKMTGLLNAAGITTFAQLSTTEVERLRKIVRDAGYAMTDPGTWPEQARLAADGDWDGLKAAQGRFKAGRRAQ